MNLCIVCTAQEKVYVNRQVEQMRQEAVKAAAEKKAANAALLKAVRGSPLPPIFVGSHRAAACAPEY